MKVRDEHGFGLIELLMAMVMLNVGILALVAAFQSGAIALKRASHISSASALASSQMELYRGLTYAQIVLDATQVGSTDNTYRCDTALGSACPNSTASDLTGTCSTVDANACNPSRTTSGSDGYRYRIDSYITAATPSTGRPLKQVTVVVRDGDTPSKTLARETSTFDQTVSG